LAWDTHYRLCLFWPLALLAAVPLTELLLGFVSESGGSFRFSASEGWLAGILLGDDARQTHLTRKVLSFVQLSPVCRVATQRQHLDSDQNWSIGFEVL
jgi:hypothetical protein